MPDIKKIKYFINYLKPYILFWVLFSVACSLFKAHEPYNESSNCGKKYPVDYIFYTELFCEVKL